MSTPVSDSGSKSRSKSSDKPISEIEPSPGLSTISDAIADIAAGKMVILVDDEDRENEGDLVIAADKCTPEAINFMAKHGRGLICLPLEEEQLDLPTGRPPPHHPRREDTRVIDHQQITGP